MFLGKGVLKTCSKFTGEHHCQSNFWWLLLEMLAGRTAVLKMAEIVPISVPPSIKTCYLYNNNHQQNSRQSIQEWND